MKLHNYRNKVPKSVGNGVTYNVFHCNFVHLIIVSVVSMFSYLGIWGHLGWFVLFLVYWVKYIFVITVWRHSKGKRKKNLDCMIIFSQLQKDKICVMPNTIHYYHHILAFDVKVQTMRATIRVKTNPCLVAHT